MPGEKWKKSLQNPAQYEALRRKGMTKEEAARTSNAQSPGHKVPKRRS
jgi:hypothetical protein